jgi:hypothetical protein
MPNYNFALIPIEHIEKYIAFANKLSSSINHIGKYHIGAQSIPHVTLLHFKAQENELALLWDRFKKLNRSKPLLLTFELLHEGPHLGMQWHLLIPDQTVLLQQMHHHALKIMNKESNHCYYPHLTLFNSNQTLPATHKTTLEHPFASLFTIAITDRDEYGQSRNILYQFK